MTHVYNSPLIKPNQLGSNIKQYMPIKYKLLNEKAKKPIKATEGSACFDLSTTESGILSPGEVRAFGTGVVFEIPENWVGLICPRSGLSLKGITVHNAPGVIDSDYRGEIKVILINSSPKDYEITEGMKIGQIYFTKYVDISLELSEEMSNTVRGDKGFGHSGV